MGAGSLGAKLRYAYDELRENASDAEWRRQRIQARIGGPATRLRYGNDGIDVPAADWDNLIVLDACRADLFEEVADTGRFDEYRRVTSKASATLEWTEKNWAGGSFGDMVYVTANPYVSKRANDAFYRLEEPWVTDFDEDAGTVTAETMRRVSRDAFDPSKRFVAHFVQPHAPFYPAADAAGFGEWSAEGESDGQTPWKALRDGDLTTDEVWDAYAETFRVGLDAALDLAADLPNRTVITSDHGNMLGGRLWPLPMRCYGHPDRLRTPELVEVPWAVIDGERRDTTTAETGETDVDEDELEERLAHLGYA